MNSNSTFRACRAMALCVSLVVTAGASWAQQAAPAAGARPAPPPRPSSSDVINSIDPNPDAEAQAKGNYPSMAREALPLGQIQRAFDDAPETALVRVVTYSPE